MLNFSHIFQTTTYTSLPQPTTLVVTYTTLYIIEMIVHPRPGHMISPVGHRSDMAASAADVENRRRNPPAEVGNEFTETAYLKYVIMRFKATVLQPPVSKHSIPNRWKSSSHVIGGSPLFKAISFSCRSSRSAYVLLFGSKSVEK